MTEDAKFKRETYARLVDYRQTHGLSSFLRLSQASRGALTTEEIHAMYMVGRMPMQKWRRLAAALTKEEQKLKN